MPRSPRDLNMELAVHFHDMALAHAQPHGRMAYRRAAQVMLALEAPIDRLLGDRPPRDIAGIGPASERIILEHLRTGESPTVARAVAGAERPSEIERARKLRTNFLSRAAATQILTRAIPGVIALKDYRGDLQMHTEWSDGAETIGDMIDAATLRGYGFIGVSDHSYGLAIAKGMSMESAARQHEEIDRLNAKYRGEFRVVKGIEANIPLEGGVDMTIEELAGFEIVLAAPHSRLRRAEEQTDRMLTTVRHPRVHILAHPRGRMFTRQGVLADWDAVFAEAVAHDVAIELDGDPWRQDLDHALARRALDAGCLFAIDSDAHNGPQLAYAEFALAHARLAGIPAARVINTWGADRLLEWAKAKSPRRRRRPTASRSVAARPTTPRGPRAARAPSRKTPPARKGGTARRKG
jgi:histidinol phosphatase-like PHP family hydrolase